MYRFFKFLQSLFQITSKANERKCRKQQKSKIGFQRKWSCYKTQTLINYFRNLIATFTSLPFRRHSVFLHLDSHLRGKDTLKSNAVHYVSCVYLYSLFSKLKPRVNRCMRSVNFLELKTSLLAPTCLLTVRLQRHAVKQKAWQVVSL